MIVSQVTDSALRAVRLARGTPQGEPDGVSVQELLSAMATFADGWIEPLCVAFWIHCVDPETQTECARATRPNPSWLVRVPALPEDVELRLPFIDPRVEIDVHLGATSVASWVERATRQECEPPGIASLHEIEWIAARALLPIDDDIQLEDGPTPVALRVEERASGRWALGPVRWRTPVPISVRGTNEYGVTELSAEIHWELWRDHPAQFDAAVERVLARGGWERA